MNRFLQMSLHGLYVYWISSIYIVASYCLKTYFDVSRHVFKVLYYQNLF